MPLRKQPLPDPASYAIVALPPGERLRAAAAAIVLHRTDHNAAEDGGLVLYNDSNRPLPLRRPRPSTGSDPYAFWKRAHLPEGMTPIPNRRA